MSPYALTHFQSETREFVRQLLCQHGCNARESLVGEHETYALFEFTFRDEEFRIWIYSDEAEFNRGGRQRLFESEAYPSLEGLSTEFMHELSREMSESPGPN